MPRKHPPYWGETEYLVLMGILQRVAERNVDGTPTVTDLIQMSNDPLSVRAIQMRDGIAAYLGIDPWEWKDQF